MPKELSHHRLHLFMAMFILISFMLGCNEYMVVGNLTLIAQTYHESLSQVSSLVAIFAWTYAIVTPILAIFTNRVHKYYLLVGLLAVFLAGTILSSCAPTLNWFIFSRVLTGAVSGMLEALLSVIAYQVIADPKQRSMAVAYIFTGFSVASVIGIPLGTVIAHHWRWQDAFVMVAVVTAIAMVIALVILPRDLSRGSGGYLEQLALLKDRQIWYGIVFVAAAAGSLYGYYTYIRPLIRQTLHFSVTQLSLWLIIIGCVDILANQMSGRLAARGGLCPLRWVYLLNLVLFASFAWLMTNQWRGLGLLLVLTFTVVLFNSPIQLYFLNRATEKYPASVNLASTFTAVFYNAGIALAAMTGGQVVRHAGLTSLGWNSFGYCLVATVFVFVLIRHQTPENKGTR